MDLMLIVAGALAILAAAVHGIGGEVLVVQRLSTATLAPSPFGGPRMTRAMIHASWHLATVAFLGAGVAFLLAGTVLDGETARGVALVAAGEYTGFAAVVVGLGAAEAGSLRLMLRHPGPALLTVTAVLAWWGAL
jgi:hypothetical protein